MRLLLEAESKIADRARAWSGARRLVVLGAAAALHVEQLSRSIGATGVEIIDPVRPDSIEADLRRATMQYVPRGQLMVAWLNGGIGAVSPAEARAMIRAIRRCMRRTDLFLIGAGEMYPAETVATMLAGAAFVAGEAVANSEYSVTVGVAD